MILIVVKQCDILRQLASELEMPAGRNYGQILKNYPKIKKQHFPLKSAKIYKQNLQKKAILRSKVQKGLAT